MLKRKITINKKAKDWKERYPLVEVKWLDICSDSSWQSLKQLQEAKLPTCVTKGHLLSQAKGITRIFGDYSEKEDGTIEEIGNTTIIPNTVIIGIDPSCRATMKSGACAVKPESRSTSQVPRTLDY
jgi:hypothetical protein